MPAVGDGGAAFAAFLAEKRPLIEAFIGSHMPAPLAEELTGDLVATSGSTVTVIAPFTGEPLYALPQSSAQDVAAAAAAARVAQEAWQAAGHAHRRRVLLRAHDLLRVRGPPVRA